VLEIAVLLCDRGEAELRKVQRHLSGLVSGPDVRCLASEGAHPATGGRLPDFELGDGHVATCSTRPVRPAGDRADVGILPEVKVAVVPRLPWPGVTRALVGPLHGVDGGDDGGLAGA
jgi:hypothetical protein